MIKNGDSAQRFLFTTNPNGISIKDNLFKDLILKSSESEPLTQKQLRNNLSKNYDLTIDKIFFQEYMEELKEGDFLKTTMDDDGNILYELNHEKFSLIKNNEENIHEIMMRFSEVILRNLPQDLAKEYKDKEKQIFIDFIQQYSEIVDKNYYKAITTGDLPDPDPDLKFECQLNGISVEFRNKLKQIYKTILLDLDGDSRDKLMSISLFWITFLRITSLNEKYRENIMSELERTKIFADTNTIIAYCCRYDDHHEYTFDYYLSLKSNLGLKIYYTERTKGELTAKIKSAEIIANSMKYFPERSRFWAKELNDGILKSYTFGNYMDWDYFVEDFWNCISKNFILYEKEDIEKLGINELDFSKERDRIKNLLLDKSKKSVGNTIMWNKEGHKAEHDLYMITLIRMIREKDSLMDWFKYTSWIATLDFAMAKIDKSIFSSSRSPNIPNISLHVNFIPYYFHPFYFLKSLSSVKNAYDLLYFSNYEIRKNNKFLDNLKADIPSIEKVRGKSQFNKAFFENIDRMWQSQSELDANFFAYAKDTFSKINGVD